MKITEEEKKKIKQLYADEAPESLIAKIFGISQTHVHRIITDTPCTKFPPELLQEWDDVTNKLKGRCVKRD